MAAKRKVDNLMALAVLSTVDQRPMHRYEMASIMRARGKDQDMDIKWGSLYTVVQNLEKHGFLETIGTTRQGARPERTVYQITEAGRQELVDWTRELLSTPEPEHPRFAAGLSVLAVLPPDEVIALLRTRLGRLEETIAARRAAITEHRQGDSPPVPGRGRVRRGDGRGGGGLGPRPPGGADLGKLPRPRDVAGLARRAARCPRSWPNSRERGAGKRVDSAKWSRGGAATPPRDPGRFSQPSRPAPRTDARTRRTRPRGGNQRIAGFPVRDLGAEQPTNTTYRREPMSQPRPKSAPHWSSAAGSPVRSPRPPCSRPASRRRSTRPTPPWPRESAAGWPWPPTAWPRSASSAPTTPSGPSPHRSPGRSWRSAGTPAGCPAWRTWSHSRSSAAATCTGSCTTGRSSRASASSTASAWSAVDEAPDSVTARFADGTTATADVLIGADGVRSTVRTLIDPDAPGAGYTGIARLPGLCRRQPRPRPRTWRHDVRLRQACLLPVLDDGGRPGHLGRQPPVEAVHVAGRGPGDPGRAVAADAARHVRRRRSRASCWPNRTTAETLEVTGAIHIMPPVPHWYRGRMVLVGDAVHAPSNSTGQGASLAIESAIQLARCLRDLPDAASAFAAYERLRRARVEKITKRGARINTPRRPGRWRAR